MFGLPEDWALHLVQERGWHPLRQRFYPAHRFTCTCLTRPLHGYTNFFVYQQFLSIDTDTQVFFADINRYTKFQRLKKFSHHGAYKKITKLIRLNLTNPRREGGLGVVWSTWAGRHCPMGNACGGRGWVGFPNEWVVGWDPGTIGRMGLGPGGR